MVTEKATSAAARHVFAGRDAEEMQGTAVSPGLMRTSSL
jgi:hypothetical protein